MDALLLQPQFQCLFRHHFPPSPASPTSTPEPIAIATATSTSWEAYINKTWGFSLGHPTGWVVSDNDTESGFNGKQVFWWVGNYDPKKQYGDHPAIDQITDVSIDGQPAKRVLGHYLGAVGDMGLQQYLKYIMQKGNVFYTVTIYAVDALGVSSSMMNETLPLQKDDIALFDKMKATLKFNHLTGSVRSADLLTIKVDNGLCTGARKGVSPI